MSNDFLTQREEQNFKQSTIWLLHRFSNIQTHGVTHTNQSYISEVFKEFGENASDNMVKVSARLAHSMGHGVLNTFVFV